MKILDPRLTQFAKTAPVRVITSLGLLSFLALTGCAPPSVEEISEKTGRNVSNLLQEAWDSAAVSVNSSSQVDQLVSALNLSATDVSGGGVSKPNFPGRNAGEDTFGDYQKFLKERVFLEDNVESTGGGAVTFLVNGKRLCTDPVSNRSDAQCEQSVDDLKLRVVVSGDPNATLTLRFEIGADRNSPLTLTIEKDRALQIDVRLNEYFKAIQALSSISTLPLSIPQTTTSALDGEVRLRLEKLGNLHFALSYDIIRDVSYDVIPSDGALRSVRIGARSPAARLEFDGQAGTHSFKGDVGKVAVRLPYKDVRGSGDDNTVIAFEFEGAALDISDAVAGALAQVSLTVRPGTNRVTYGGGEIFSLTPPQTVTARLVKDTDGRLKVEVNEFETTAAFRIELLPGQLDLKESGAYNESYRVSLKGANPALRFGKVGGDTAVKFIDSTFEVKALNANRAVTVAAGQCLASNQNPVSTDIPLLRSIAAASCE